MVRMSLDKLLELGGIATISQRTTGLHIGHQHLLVGTKYFGGLTHKMHTTHQDDIGIGLGSLPGQSQRIADEVSHLLNLIALIIMSHNQRILLPLQSQNFIAESLKLLFHFLFISLIKN